MLPLPTAPVRPAPRRPASDVSRLLDMSTIYYEPDAIEHPRGREIVAGFPDADLIEVESHWRIPGLFGNAGNVEHWNRIKRTVLVLGRKRSLAISANGRSTDFLAPSTANGCAMACAYCYVPRNKGYANPIAVFVNADETTAAIRRHAGRLGPKTEPNQVDASHWVYDIGVNSDCSVDAALSDNVPDSQRRLARGQPGLASHRRGSAVDAGEPGGEGFAGRGPQRALPPGVQGPHGRPVPRTARATPSVYARPICLLSYWRPCAPAVVLVAARLGT